MGHSLFHRALNGFWPISPTCSAHKNILHGMRTITLEGPAPVFYDPDSRKSWGVSKEEPSWD